MAQNQEEERQAISKAFMESLKQLEALQSVDGTEAFACPNSCSNQPAAIHDSIDDRPCQPTSLQLSSLEETISIDLNALADAAADIDQFMQAMQATQAKHRQATQSNL
jgi:hypothetical protein